MPQSHRAFPGDEKPLARCLGRSLIHASRWALGHQACRFRVNLAQVAGVPGSLIIRSEAHQIAIVERIVGYYRELIPLRAMRQMSMAMAADRQSTTYGGLPLLPSVASNAVARCCARGLLRAFHLGHTDVTRLIPKADVTSHCFSSSASKSAALRTSPISASIRGSVRRTRSKSSDVRLSTDSTSQYAASTARCRSCRSLPVRLIGRNASQTQSGSPIGWRPLPVISSSDRARSRIAANRCSVLRRPSPLRRSTIEPGPSRPAVAAATP